MSEAETGPPAEDRLLQEAAAWFARMRGPDAEASRDEFEAWLARGALHRRAYNRAAEIFAMGKVLGDNQGPTTSGAGRDGHWNWRVLAALGATLLALVTTTWLALRATMDAQVPGERVAESDTRRERNALQLTTVPGETRTVGLADGSVVRLEADTVLGVAFDRAARRLSLERGKARFRVAREARRFVVYAGGGQVTARGTMFHVGLGADRRVTVRLIEGIVEVTLPSSGSGSPRLPAPRRLWPGQTMSFTARSEASPEQPATTEGRRSSGSSQGRPQAAQEYEAVRLAELIAAANRRASPPIRLAEPAIGERRVSGRFRTHDADILAERLAALFHLAVDRSDPAEIVLRPR